MNPQTRTRTHWHIFYQYFQWVAKSAKCQFMPKTGVGRLFLECFRVDNDMPIFICQNRTLANRKLLKSLQCQMPIYATLKGKKKLAHLFANTFTLDFRAILIFAFSRMVMLLDGTFENLIGSGAPRYTATLRKAQACFPRVPLSNLGI
ncbi:MAG: hypothetical protein ABSC04_20595 [Syntrophobacteraceae bacterium]